MVSGFICGTSKLPREEEGYERHTRSADSSPKRSRSKSSNPYSTRGREKFSSLLAEIEEKRQQIYSRVNPNEICVVRFEYSGDHDFRPIIVKSKNGNNIPNNNNNNNNKVFDHQVSIKQVKSLDISDQKRPSKIIKKLQSSKSLNFKEENTHNNNNNNNNNGRLLILRNINNQWRETMLILPMIVILILIFLVLFGRSFAIMCTSIGWYVIPTIITNKNASNSSSNNLKVSFKRKDYAIRRLSEKKLMINEGRKLSFKN